MAAASPRSSLTGADLAALMALAPSMATDDDAQFLPWKIAFRVRFQSEKFGLRFHPAQFPDTGNGVYTIRLLELIKASELSHSVLHGPDGSGPAQHYNASLMAGQEHLVLRPGLYLTHINDEHLVDEPCETVIQRLQNVPRPVTLRFVDVEAGVVTRHELRDSLALDPESLAAISWNPGASGVPSPAYASGGAASPRSPSGRGGRQATAASPRGNAAALQLQSPLYKIILLGTTGVGKSSILAVGVIGDSAYAERRPTTLEPEFGAIEIADPDISNPSKIRARIWDTAGQERYRAITRSHYRRADGALLVYDVADPDSFEKLGEWLKTLQETAEDSLKCIMVVENKADQLPELQTGGAGGAARRAPRPSAFVQEERVRTFCSEHGLLFARTTAKMNACAFKWEAQKVSDAVSHLLLSIHAATLARGLSQHGLAESAGGAASSSSGTDGKVILIGSPRGTAFGGAAQSDSCGSCGKN